MRRIDGQSAVDGQPYANLLPMVDRLLRFGNAAVDGGFILNPDGWRCRLADPIDVAAVRREFDVPASIWLSDAYDTILDTGSWCSIEGPGAHPRAEKLPSFISDPTPMLSVSETSALLVVAADVSSVDNAVLSWRDAGLTVRVARGRKMRTVERLFDEMAAALQFPYYFGENWPAFEECLSDMDWLPSANGIVILISDAIHVLSDEDEGQLAALVRMIETARREYAAPIEAGEWRDRPAVPFHVVLHSSDRGYALVARWRTAGAEIGGNSWKLGI